MFNFTCSKQLPDPKKSVIGVVAGSGSLPETLTQEILNKGYVCKVLSVDSDRQTQLAGLAPDCLNISIREGAKALSYLKEKKVTHLIFAGKVIKDKLYGEGFESDEVSSQVIKQTVKGRGDERIMRVVESIARINGFKILGVNSFLTRWIPAKGVLGQAKPSATQIQDMEYGFKMAKAIGRLDIGQSVVVKDSTVLAVEGIEGTNRMLQRVSDLKITKSILAKASKPQQNIKFDMPVVGIETIEHAVAADCTAIVVEAGRTLLVQYEQLIHKMNQHNMVLYGV